MIPHGSSSPLDLCFYTAFLIISDTPNRVPCINRLFNLRAFSVSLSCIPIWWPTSLIAIFHLLHFDFACMNANSDYRYGFQYPWGHLIGKCLI